LFSAFRRSKVASHLAMRRWMLRCLLTHWSALRELLASALPCERLATLLAPKLLLCWRRNFAVLAPKHFACLPAVA
jgi:hypothetical protein